MRVLQVNLGRGRAAHDMAIANARQKGVDLVVVSEVNKKIGRKSGWIMDLREDAGIYVVNRKMKGEVVVKGKGYVGVSVSGVLIVSCYFSPNSTMEVFKEEVDEMMSEVRRRGRNVIVAGDMNAKSEAWGAGCADARGEHVNDWVAELGLIVMNVGGEPTFVRGASESHIDITLATSDVAVKVKGWKVLKEDSLSLHRYIWYEWEGGDKTKKDKGGVKRWMDSKKLKESMEREVKMWERRKWTPDMCTGVITVAQRKATIKGKEQGWQPYWWGEEIDECRKRCNGLRRKWTRMRGRDSREGMEELEKEMKEKRGELRKLITRAKRNKWREVCKALDEDVWGEGYKIVRRELGGGFRALELTTERKWEIIEELFPMDGEGYERERKRYAVPPFTKEELQEAIERTKGGKAPGMDGVTPEGVKMMWRVAPKELLEMFNTLAREQNFPEQWKKAKVVLIPKGKNKEGRQEAGAFRPVSLTSVLGKVFERMIVRRLEERMRECGPLSERQFGFRRGRSAIQAVGEVLGYVKGQREGWTALIALDVKNAFNTAPWGKIVEGLRFKVGRGYLVNMVEAFLTGREVYVEDGGGRVQNRGVPQGSVLGPTLWNVLYDGVLNLSLPAGVRSFAYADDLIVAVRVVKKEELGGKVNRVVNIVDGWMGRNGLELAHSKTEIIVVPRGRRLMKGMTFQCGGHQIVAGRALKYLGVWVDDLLIFGRHVQETVAKTERMVAALGRLMMNVGGPSWEKRMVMCGAALSSVLYGAPIFSQAMRIGRHRDRLIALQRRWLLRVTSAYRTASACAVQAVAGQLPIDLLVEERARWMGGEAVSRGNLRAEMMDKWQDRWRNERVRGQWTKRLIPNVVAWADCSFKQIDYYMTQFLTGHGCFEQYLHRFGKRREPGCRYCGVSDSVEHTFFVCERWGTEREDVRREVGDNFTVEGVARIMLRNKNGWILVREFVRKVLIMKEREEREREKANERGNER